MKKLIIGSAVSAAAIGLAAFLAVAQTPTPESPQETPPLKVEMLHTGKVLVRGAKVTNIATSTITAVTSWGAASITWIVNIDNSTGIIRRNGGSGSLSEIAKDHIVSFEGQLVTAASQMTVNARVVRDWSVQKAEINPFGVVMSIDSTAKSFVLKTEKREYGDLMVATSENTEFLKLKATTTFSALKAGDKVTVNGLWDRAVNTLQAKRVKIQIEDRRVFEGGQLKSVASVTPPTSIVVTFGKFDYTVNVAVDTSVLNEKWLRASLADFKTGNNIRVYGVADGTTIDATVVRNTSLK